MLISIHHCFCIPLLHRLAICIRIAIIIILYNSSDNQSVLIEYTQSSNHSVYAGSEILVVDAVLL